MRDSFLSANCMQRDTCRYIESSFNTGFENIFCVYMVISLLYTPSPPEPSRSKSRKKQTSAWEWLVLILEHKFTTDLVLATYLRSRTYHHFLLKCCTIDGRHAQLAGTACTRPACRDCIYKQTSVRCSGCRGQISPYNTHLFRAYLAWMLQRFLCHAVYTWTIASEQWIQTWSVF